MPKCLILPLAPKRAGRKCSLLLPQKAHSLAAAKAKSSTEQSCVHPEVVTRRVKKKKRKSHISRESTCNRYKGQRIQMLTKTKPPPNNEGKTQVLKCGEAIKKGCVTEEG